MTGGATDHAKVVLTPAAALANATTYNLLIQKGVISNDGVPSAAWIIRQFTTAA